MFEHKIEIIVPNPEIQPFVCVCGKLYYDIYDRKECPTCGRKRVPSIRREIARLFGMR